jgi:hypothetical protein
MRFFDELDGVDFGGVEPADVEAELHRDGVGVFEEFFEALDVFDERAGVGAQAGKNAHFLRAARDFAIGGRDGDQVGFVFDRLVGVGARRRKREDLRVGGLQKADDVEAAFDFFFKTHAGPDGRARGYRDQLDLVLRDDFVEDFDAVFELLNHAGAGFDTTKTGGFNVGQSRNKTIFAPR